MASRYALVTRAFRCIAQSAFVESGSKEISPIA
jgi:hypothetical protein